jgi:hypothetical protein
MDVKGVFPALVGGLGNQMFILAAAYIISRRKGCPLYLTKNHNHHNQHNTLQLDYKKSIFQHFGTHLDMTESEFISQANYKEFKPSGFHPWVPDNCETGSVLKSYFQYYPPLAPFEDELRSLFKNGLQEFTPQKNIQTPTAFVHIRRGDYLAISHIHFVQPISYYEKGVALLLKENPDITEILVFSDDIEWVKQQQFFRGNSLFTFIDEPNELKALALMSQCKGGAVCANSTFSWWGAFLGAYEMRKPVIVPKRWISEPVYDLFPPEWIQLEAC